MWDTLPDDCWSEILNKVNDFSDLKRISSVCKFLRRKVLDIISLEMGKMRKLYHSKGHFCLSGKREYFVFLLDKFSSTPIKIEFCYGYPKVFKHINNLRDCFREMKNTDICRIYFKIGGNITLINLNILDYEDEPLRIDMGKSDMESFEFIFFRYNSNLLGSYKKGRERYNIYPVFSTNRFLSLEEARLPRRNYY